MSKKIYAVKVGRTTGILYDWNECKASVSGYPNAEYKSFLHISDAEAYLYGKGEKKAYKTKNTAIAYVDGSYNKVTKEYGSGVVLFHNDKTFEFSSLGKSAELAKMHNVGGELAAVSIAVKEAVRLGAKRIIIFHDYKGISEWANGGWTANKTGTIAYKEFVERMRKDIAIDFKKVEAHSGDRYNELADKLAKKAVGIK